MELSQSLGAGLDLSKLGLEPQQDDGGDIEVSAEGSTLARLASLLVALGAVDDAEAVTSDSTLDALGVDSLSRIEFAVRAEEHFGVRMSEELFNSWATLGEMAAYLEQHSAQETK